MTKSEAMPIPGLTPIILLVIKLRELGLGLGLTIKKLAFEPNFYCGSTIQDTNFIQLKLKTKISNRVDQIACH